METKEIEALWNKMQQADYSFDDRMRNRPDLFVVSLFNGTHFLNLDDIGLVTLTGLVPGSDVVVHTTIWGKQDSRRVLSLFHNALELIFKEFGLVRITTIAADYHPQGIRLAKLMGFTEEGRMRKAILFKNVWYDAIIYGILREEILPPEEAQNASTSINPGDH
jgi:hypothetical protein